MNGGDGECGEDAPPWNPPSRRETPPATVPLAINCRIPSDLDHLERLHEVYPWIPGREMIRPPPHVIKEKHEALAMESAQYGSVEEYVLRTIFTIEHPLRRFVKHRFPYDLPPSTQHYLMWYRKGPPREESMIDFHIRYELDRMLTSENENDDDEKKTSYEYVWYPNPKPTVDVYHVQVFWRFIVV